MADPSQAAVLPHGSFGLFYSSSMNRSTDYGLRRIASTRRHWLRFEEDPNASFYPLIVKLSYPIERNYQRQVMRRKTAEN